MSASEQTHETPGLKPGDKVLVEAEWNGGVFEDGDYKIETWQKGSRGYVWADPATVHPASVLEELRAEITELKNSRRESWDMQREWAVAMEKLWRFVEPDGCSRSLPNDYLLSIMAAIQEAQDELRNQVADAREASEGLRTKLAASVAAANRNADWAMNTEQERDAARRDLAELRAEVQRLAAHCDDERAKAERFMVQAYEDRQDCADLTRKHKNQCDLITDMVNVIGHKMGETPMDTMRRVIAERDDLRVKLAAAQQEVEAEKLLSENRLRLVNEMHDERDTASAEVASERQVSHGLCAEIREIERLTTAYNIQYGQLWQARKSGDTARRELAEALEWMRANQETCKYWWETPDPHFVQGRAILARHPQPECEERRKGERRKGEKVDKPQMKPDLVWCSICEEMMPVVDGTQCPICDKQIRFPKDEAPRPYDWREEVRSDLRNAGHSEDFIESSIARRAMEEKPTDPPKMWNDRPSNKGIDWKASYEAMVARNQELYELHAEAVEIGRAAEIDAETSRQAMNHFAAGLNLAEEEVERLRAEMALVSDARQVAEAECERLRNANAFDRDRLEAANSHASKSFVRADWAEAKLEAIKTAIEDGQSTGYCLYLICGPEPILDTPPAQQEAEPVKPTEWHHWNDGDGDWELQVQARIEALEAAQKARA